MIPALDSSFNRPTLAQARAAYAAGVRVWGGYFGSRGGLGLATLWSRQDFANVQDAGIVPIGFCSGWDDPTWIRSTAASWGILACVDVEHGIRDDGPWVPGFVSAAQCGLYGPMSVHYQTGESAGRGALCNILAWYPGFDPRATWFDAIEVRPPGPCGWQWLGTHSEFGLSVDRSWLDDLILPSGPGRGGADAITGGSSMGTTGGFYDPATNIDHTFELSPDGHLLWGRTIGGVGGEVHVGWWDLGAPPAEGGVVDFGMWPTQGSGIIVRAKSADGTPFLCVIVDRNAGSQGAATGGNGWWGEERPGPYRVPGGGPGPQGPAGPPGPAVDVVALTDAVLTAAARRLEAAQ